MDDKFQKSGILEWSNENIEKSPITSGVFVLTNSPTNGTVVELKFVNNLHDDLNERFRSNKLQPKFFYWYSTSNLEEAEALFKRLLSHYKLDSEVSSQ